MSDVGERELLAIIFTDAVDSTARTATDEDYSLRILLADLDYMRNEAAVRGGTVLKNTGDGLLISFKSAVDAVECALSIQKGFANRAENAAFTHKIGVHIGDVIKKDGDIYGSGVNTASRLVAQCPAGGICMSSTLYELVKQKSQIGQLEVKDFQLTNIEPPLKAFRLESFSADIAKIPNSKKDNKKASLWSPRKIALIAVFFAITGLVFFKNPVARQAQHSWIDFWLSPSSAKVQETEVPPIKVFVSAKEHVLKTADKIFTPAVALLPKGKYQVTAVVDAYFASGNKLPVKKVAFSAHSFDDPLGWTWVIQDGQTIEINVNPDFHVCAYFVDGFCDDNEGGATLVFRKIK